MEKIREGIYLQEYSSGKKEKTSTADACMHLEKKMYVRTYLLTNFDINKILSAAVDQSQLDVHHGCRVKMGRTGVPI